MQGFPSILGGSLRESSNVLSFIPWFAYYVHPASTDTVLNHSTDSFIRQCLPSFLVTRNTDISPQTSIQTIAFMFTWVFPSQCMKVKTTQVASSTQVITIPVKYSFAHCHSVFCFTTSHGQSWYRPCARFTPLWHLPHLYHCLIKAHWLMLDPLPAVKCWRALLQLVAYMNMKTIKAIVLGRLAFMQPIITTCLCTEMMLVLLYPSLGIRICTQSSNATIVWLDLWMPLWLLAQYLWISVHSLRGEAQDCVSFVQSSLSWCFWICHP